VDDVSRLCQRFLLGRADFNDLISMNAAIGTWATLEQSCKNERCMEVIERHLAPHADEWDSVETLFQRMTNLAELSERISQAVIDSSDSSELPIGEEVTSKLNLTEEGDIETQSSNLENQDKKWSINPRCVFRSLFVPYLTFLAAFRKSCLKCMLLFRTWSNKRSRWRKLCRLNVVCF
jgi:hypothetical protein